MLRLFYSDLYTIPLPAGHKFPMEKYRALREALAGDPRFVFEQSPLATQSEVELAHDARYVEQFLSGRLEAAAIRRIGFPWSQQLVARTLASAGGTLAATKTAWREGCSGALAGGTHHAYYAEGSGFCVFNDIAIGILWLFEQGLIRRAAVIDLDVHQGDGTAAIFSDDPRVFTLSVHCASNFPLRKQHSSLDIAICNNAENGFYLETVYEALPQVFAFQPDVVFYQAGVDGLVSDRLGKLALTKDGLQVRDRLVLEACKARAIPVVITIGGGYSDPICLSVEAHANTFRVAADLFVATRNDSNT